ERRPGSAVGTVWQAAGINVGPVTVGLIGVQSSISAWAVLVWIRRCVCASIEERDPCSIDREVDGDGQGARQRPQRRRRLSELVQEPLQSARIGTPLNLHSERVALPEQLNLANIAEQAQPPTQIGGSADGQLGRLRRDRKSTRL